MNKPSHEETTLNRCARSDDLRSMIHLLKISRPRFCCFTIYILLGLTKYSYIRPLDIFVYCDLYNLYDFLKY